MDAEAEPPMWVLRDDPQRGRGLWATRDIAAGTPVLLAHAFSSGVGDASCAACLVDLAAVGGGADGPRCAGCGMRYCSLTCASDDTHTARACAMLRRLRSSADWDTPIVRHLVRLVCALGDPAAPAPARGSGADLIALAQRLRATPDRTQLAPADVFALDACRVRMPTDRYKSVAATSKFVLRLWRKARADVEPRAAPVAAAEPADVAGALCRIMHNGFAVRNARGDEVGCALLPTASMFNHSCEPSCKLRATLGGARAGRSLEFETARALTAGDELTISYVDVSLPRETRRERLDHSYYFACACARCA
ncbi:hypothetical protein KFE25_009662 [Diacronema lutheri]|uniref:SET domain-containing protein n=1 Tax=Diacronema lutheri TaxID=2081491 RepID=A0A8J5XY86_DIALT|nr:hypothetical protein KFE25_009662 [Diacronema lutheri]